jgi:uncharacterized phiE125 gp8 family phage protein
MSYTVITPASLKALTVQEVKDYLRVDSSDEDTLLGVLIDAATQVGEHYLGRFLLTTVVEEFYDFFPVYQTGVDPFRGDRNIVYLSRGPVQSITRRQRRRADRKYGRLPQRPSKRACAYNARARMEGYKGHGKRCYSALYLWLHPS